MKLLYLWVDNYKEKIKNQSFNISRSYNIDFDTEHNRLFISKNKEYIDDFYGDNMLDITAIVGKNGAGKTTIARFLYDECNSVHPVNEDKEYVFDYTKKILVFEKEGQTEAPHKLVVQYYLEQELKIRNNSKSIIEPIDLKGIRSDKFEQAEQEHDVTTVYFTNSFEIHNVMNNQGLSEFSLCGVHKSLCYTPMLSLQRALKSQRNHYGAENISTGMIFDVINQYAQNMTADFKKPYATAEGYNFLIATRFFPGAIARILPVMDDFKLEITEFGEYAKFQKNFLRQSGFDQTVMFIRQNIYENIKDRFKSNHWEQLYLNIICEMVLFFNMFASGNRNVEFDELEKKHMKIGSDEAFKEILGQIEDNEHNIPKKKLIKRIKNVQGVDLSIIKDFIELQDENLDMLKESRWYTQVKNFWENYNTIKDIEIAQTINDGYTKLIELIIKNYNNGDTVFGRMISIVPQPMSSGEVAMINIFATVYSALRKETSGSILLIIDEIDAFLHPKWQQDILTYITRWINESEQFNNKKVQLIVATHSPIILSDIPKDKILYLEKPFEVSSGEQFTFGANMGTLFYDSFFMKEGSIGGIAKKEIQWAIDNIGNTNLSLDAKKRLIYIIDNIGDKFLREKLKTYPIYIEMTATKGKHL